MKALMQNFIFKVTFTNHDPMATCRCSVNQTHSYSIKDHSKSLAYDKLHTKLTKELKYEDITFTIE